MKKRVENQLLLLLGVRAGICPDHVREKLVRSLSSDPLLNRRWNLLNRVWDREALPVPEIDRRAVEGDLFFDPETIASFVEGRLDREQANIVATTAWNSPALLVEICDIFRAVHVGESMSDEFGSWSSVNEERLSNRLIALFDRENSDGKPWKPEMAEPVNGAISSQSVHAAELSGKSPRENRIGKWVASILAIAAAIVVIVRLLPVLTKPAEVGDPSANIGNLAGETANESNDGSSGAPVLAETENNNSRSTEEGVSTTGGEGLAENEITDGPRSPIENHGKGSAESREPWFAYSGDLPSAESVKTPGTDDMSQPNSDNGSTNGETANEEAFTVVKENLRFELEQVKGIVGLFVEPTGLWRGYASNPDSKLEDQATTVVFTGSWVRARIPGAGEWVFDADTEIRLSRESLVAGSRDRHASEDPDMPVRAPQYCLEVLSGRVGIENLPNKTDLAIRYMNREFNVKAASDDTFIAFDVYGEQPVLSVRRGKIEIDGNELPAGRSRLFNGENVGQDLPTRHSLRWLDRPEKYVRLSDKLQTELLAASDLCEEFQRIVRLDEPATRRTAGLWLMSVKPELIAESLRNPNVNDWNLLMEWLGAQHRRGYRQRAVWVSLGEMVGDEQFGRQLFQWTRMLELRQKPSVEQVDRFMTYLNHESLFARFAAARVLEDCFANPFQYEPMLSPERRIAATRAWRRHIIQLLGQ